MLLEIALWARRRSIIIGAVLSVAVFLSLETWAATRIVRIAVLSDRSWVLEPIDEVLRAEVSSLLEGEFDARFPPAIQVQANASLERAEELLSQLLENPDVDVIIALGPLATQALATKQVLSKPCFGTIVIDPGLQGFTLTGQGTTGRHNLALSVDSTSLIEAIEEFKQLTPLETAAFFIDPALIEALPAIETRLRAFEAEFDIRIVPVPWKVPLETSVEGIPADVDGALIGPLLGYDANAVQKFADALIARGVPSFSLVSSKEVELGLLATMSPSADTRQLGRRVALQIQDTLLGADPGNLPVTREAKTQLTLNAETARALNLQLRYDILSRAVLLGADAPATGRALSLRDAIDESLKRNLDLLSEDRVVASGREDILIALAALLPQVSAASSVSWIDKDRAAAGAPARLSSGTLSGRQVLFDEFLLANYRIARHTQDSTDAIREQVQQDVIQATGNAFVQVLRAETALRIQRDNLRVTRANLDLARIRREVGTSGASEVYRWESEEANGARDLINAQADLENIRIALNRVLDRPIEEAFATEDIALGDVSYTFADPRVRPYLETPSRLQSVRDYLVGRGLQSAPELTSFDALIRAQERLLASRRRTFFLPRVTADAQAERVFDEGGRGADLRPDDDTRWSAGVEASIPIAEGGGRLAEARQARENLSRLRIDRRSEALRVEERIRTAANLASASFIAIDLTRRAATAARRNLDLVTESYARGAIDIIDLLDAQNTSFTAEQQAANAVYDHVIDLLELQRAGGRFEFFQSDSEREQNIQQLEQFLQARVPGGATGP